MKHATNWSGIDMTLCGLALEAFEDQKWTDVAGPVELAKAREVVDCPHCCACIKHCQEGFSTHISHNRPAGLWRARR